MKPKKKLLVPRLKKGDRNKAVVVLRRLLRPYSPEVYRRASTSGSDHFDSDLVNALKAYQMSHGLTANGKLDAPTRNLLQKPRCGNEQKYVPNGARWTNAQLTYAVQNTPAGISLANARAAIRSSLDVWESVTNLLFQEVDPLVADILIRFATGAHGDSGAFDGPGAILAHAYPPPPLGGDLAGDVHFDGSETWSITVSTPVNAKDLMTVAIHELGHSLGLGHSSVTNSVMYAYYNGPRRQLQQDDIAGIQSLYNPRLGTSWEFINGSALDVAIGGDGTLWVIGTNQQTGGYGIFVRQNGSWRALDGSGVRIAVDSNGHPWIVNSSFGIYHHNGQSWVQLPGLGRDIAVGPDNLPWVIGYTESGQTGYGIYKWTGTQWIQYPGAAVRIAVDATGMPWVTNSAKQIYRWTGSGWIQVPGLAHDIGIGQDGTVWVVGDTATGSGNSIHCLCDGSWQDCEGSATSIAVGPDGLPLVCNSEGGIYRRKPKPIAILSSGSLTSRPIKTKGPRVKRSKHGNASKRLGG